MDPQIPLRFLGFDSLMYLLSAFVGFLISYYAFKLYKVTKKRSHFTLHLSFTILSIGLLVLVLTTAYFYMNYYFYKEFTAFDPISYVDDFGYWIYYLSSLLANSLLAFTYFSEDWKLPILLPVWATGFPYFHITSFLILSYVVFKNAINYWMRRNKNAFLVTLGFILIACYHFLMFFSFFHRFIYALADLSLLLGFMSLLLMLSRVCRK